MTTPAQPANAHPSVIDVTATVPKGPSLDDPQSLTRVLVSQIQFSKTNTRNEADFTGQEWEEFVATIQQLGLLTPLLLAPRFHRIDEEEADPKYELVAGERRLRAALQLGYVSVPAHIVALDDAGAREAQLIENLQRKGLQPLQYAKQLQGLIDLITPFHAAAKRDTLIGIIAKRISKSARTVYDFLALLKAEEPVAQALDAGKLSASEATEISRAPVTEQKKLVDEHTAPGAKKGLRALKEKVAKVKPLSASAKARLESVSKDQNGHRPGCKLSAALDQAEDPKRSRAKRLIEVGDVAEINAILDHVNPVDDAAMELVLRSVATVQMSPHVEAAICKRFNILRDNKGDLYPKPPYAARDFVQFMVAVICARQIACGQSFRLGWIADRKKLDVAKIRLAAESELLSHLAPAKKAPPHGLTKKGGAKNRDAKPAKKASKRASK